MVSWLPSVPYPPARDDGYWAPITSTLDWCEENYYATQYSAEIVNSLTNLMFMLLAAKGIRSCLQNDHDRVFLVTYIGYLIVGSGSFAFHSTLKYPMQLVDELSMIYTTCIMCWATFGQFRSRSVQTLLGVGLAGLAAFITLYYHYLQDPTFHQNAYALLTAVVLLRSMYVMEINLRPSRRETSAVKGEGKLTAKQKAEDNRVNERDSKLLKQMWITVGAGLTIFLIGFGIWQLDNIYCSKLRAWRHEIGLPWGILLEGHGWWHIMTGYGAYCYICWGTLLRHCLNGKADEYELKWDHWYNIPEVTRRRPTSTNHQNGSAKHPSKKLN